MIFRLDDAESDERCLPSLFQERAVTAFAIGEPICELFSLLSPCQAHDATITTRESSWLGPTFWPIPYETVSGGFGFSVFFCFS